MRFAREGQADGQQKCEEEAVPQEAGKACSGHARTASFR
jgi:hypothetical protein